MYEAEVARFYSHERRKHGLVQVFHVNRLRPILEPIGRDRVRRPAEEPKQLPSLSIFKRLTQRLCVKFVDVPPKGGGILDRLGKCVGPRRLHNVEQIGKHQRIPPRLTIKGLTVGIGRVSTLLGCYLVHFFPTQAFDLDLVFGRVYGIAYGRPDGSGQQGLRPRAQYDQKSRRELIRVRQLAHQGVPETNLAGHVVQPVHQ